jgi:hypothetical protein
MKDVSGLVFVPPSLRFHFHAQAGQTLHQGFEQGLRSAVGQKKWQAVGKQNFHDNMARQNRRTDRGCPWNPRLTVNQLL